MKIDKGIPVPDMKFYTRGRKKETKYPWGDMDMYDSVFFPCLDRREYYRIIVHMHRWAKEHGRLFMIRKRTEMDVDGIRIWRIL